ncbi:MAG TPA: sulfotransferase [Caulobacteraceae bacterium]|nr:sulfotransferase [Caulobacteraceae bacterium]
MTSRSGSRREQAKALHDVGVGHLATSSWEPARDAFNEALVLNPTNAESHLGLAQAHRNLGQWPEAERAVRAALEADASYAKAAHYLGALLVELDRLQEALPFLQAAAEWEPAVAQHHRDLGVTQLFLGDVENARTRLLRTIQLDVHSHEVLYTLIRGMSMDDDSVGSRQLMAVVRELAEKAGDLPDAERAQVLFSLGKAHEDRKEYKEAAEVFAEANAVKRATFTYDVGAAATKLKHYAEVFDATTIARLTGYGCASTRPIFIIGMPRSGSTLIEQILSAHPDVHGAGEVYVMPGLLEASTGAGGVPYPDWARTMNAADAVNVGQAYVDRMPTGLPGKTRTTDKWLENFEHLALIAMSLPEAKVIHCHRDPRDQLLSCWSLLFSQNQEYAYDIDELRRYYRTYRDLMEHWRAVLPSGLMLEVRYEAVVAEPEAQSRRILAHCGLEWDDDVLRFWESRRPVKSASMFQVREPIYDRSIGRWKPFAKLLAPLFKGLVPD